MRASRTPGHTRPRGRPRGCVLRWSRIFGGVAGNFLALAGLVDARLASIQSAFNAHTHVETGGTTQVPVPLIGTLDTVASTKVKGY